MALLGFVSLVGMAALYAVIPTDFVARKLTLATAYVGLGLVCLSLLIGPWYVLQGRRSPVSNAWRRDVGIWAAGISALHALVGLRVHFGGDWVRYFWFRAKDGAHRLPIRTDPIGWANYVGLAATLVVLLLLAISNDIALRRLGAVRWKSLQRLNYLGFGLIGIHGAIYQVLGRRPAPAVILLGLMLGLTVSLQLAGILRRHRRAAAA